MAQPYVGELRMFAGNFAPAGWMFCEGQLLPISEAETGGAEEITLTVNQIPAHTHPMLASQNVAQDASPQNKVTGQSGAALIYIQDIPDANLSPQAVTSVGGSQPHTNFQPYLCINFIISLFGIFPSPT
jgi:microcystin-dependent protein